ncbi:N-acetylmuramic acid 6-phosphate etherase [Actinomyces minihominis]|uniref:N-acetylmuramic acid 6-phosphate etherase n=1 Tax=Actinomyces minihominis TaxID=2002838 RepID=UPI000C07D0CB|nr:N-acetylmuramic acid 6-phosphate etherase [Actinomyces minihominis]
MKLNAEHENQISTSITESVDPRYAELDLLPTEDLVQAMNEAEMEVPVAVSKVIPQIAAAVDAISAGMKKGGRLFYAGAGTSGRLGVLDASECPPTFSSHPDQVVGIIAGGDDALRNAIEGAEDNFDEGYQALRAYDLTSNDTVVGIAASGRTPFALGAVTAGKDAGATTVSISNNSPAELSKVVDFPIEVVVGPEIITGSTRLKSGSSQKQVLNILSTATMVRLGKTYGNLMVDVSASNLKLEVRARNLVMRITECDQETAEKTLAASGGSVKIASVALLRGITPEEAVALLDANDGVMRAALNS